MAVVVKWKVGGDYLESAHVGPSGQRVEWTPDQRRAKRFDGQKAFLAWTRDVGLWQMSENPWWWGEVKYVRLVPKRRVEAAKRPCQLAAWDADTLRRDGWKVLNGRWAKPGCEVLREDSAEHLARLVAIASAARQKAPPATSEPTPRDAVAGMLLRAERTLREIADEIGAPHASDYSNLPRAVRAEMKKLEQSVAMLNEARAEAAALREERDRLQREWEQQGARLHELESCVLLASGRVAPAKPDDTGREEREDTGRIAIPGANDLHLFSARPDGRVDLIVPKALDPRAALSTVAELLGISPDVAALDEVTFQRLTPDELEELALRTTINGGIGAGWLRGVAAGIREGERRAKVKAAELVALWGKERVEHRETAAKQTALIKAEPSRSRQRFGFARGCEFVVDNCMSDVRDAFSLPADGRFRLRPEDVSDALPLSPSAMTPANGWRYIGRPASEAQLEESATPAGYTVTHGGVTVTAPETMTLGEVWAALVSSPALRVCFDGKTRRAHADGVVEGLRRARRILKDLDGHGLAADVALDVLDDRLGGEVALAKRNAAHADRQPNVDGAALIDLAEGWEDMAASLGMDARADDVCAGKAFGLRAAATDIRRLLGAPRGPRRGEREPNDMRDTQDAGGGP